MFGRASLRSVGRLGRVRGGGPRVVPRQLRCSAGYATLDTEEQKHYYCLGVNIGRQLDNGTLNGLTPSDVAAICAGVADVLNEAEMRSGPCSLLCQHARSPCCPPVHNVPTPMP